MSRFEKISAIIAVIGLSIQFTGLCIQFTRSLDSPTFDTVQTPISQTSSILTLSTNRQGCTPESLLFLGIEIGNDKASIQTHPSK
ncbi:hypothetical protein [Nostoc sp.]|uniref:hypothetical protein n=1 Tax=Nostoc sp. TaxID=1180 RepID=UPI002FF795A6